MRLCIPKIGSMMLLTEDWTIPVEDGKGVTWTHSLEHLVCIQYESVKAKNYQGQEYIQTKKVGTLTFPKGTILKLESIEMWANRQKRYHQPDCVEFSIIETPLEYKVDSEVIKTKTGRISKKKKERPTVCFKCSPEIFNNIEFEFTI